MDPPLFSAVMGGEKKREGVETIVTDTGSVTHHPRLWRRAGVGVRGLVEFCDVPRDTMLQGILQVGSASAQTVREIPLAPMGILRRRPKEATTPLHHNCSGDGGPPSLPPSTQPITRAETVNRVEATSAGVSAGVGGRTGGIGRIGAES